LNVTKLLARPMLGRMRVVRLAMVLGAVLWVNCTGPGPTAAPRPIESLRLLPSSPGGPIPLIVHEMKLFEVEATKTDGGLIRLPAEGLIWETSDPTVATVSEEGVVSAQGRGEATIRVTSGEVFAEANVVVKARVTITPSPVGLSCFCGGTYQFWSDEYWRLGVGDALPLTATYVDIDGVPIDEEPHANWISSDPAAVSVDAEGRVVALVRSRFAGITAATPDGAAYAHVQVLDTISGRPATVRLAHGAVGLDAVTFEHNKGDPVTLEFGESLEIPITSGFFLLQARGVPFLSETAALEVSRSFLVLEGDQLSLYVVGGKVSLGPGVLGPRAELAWAWDRPTHVSDDSVRIRLVQGFTGLLGVHVLSPGEPADELPELCYFDPGDAWGYDTRPAGGIDVVLQRKFGAGNPQHRVRVNPPPGSSVTYVIDFATPNGDGYNLVAFPDP
jgi:hypothetical protein